MAEIEVTVPSLLSGCMRGQTCFPLEASTLADALQRMLATYPLVCVHLHDEVTRLRRHLVIFYNGKNIAWLERHVEPGDVFFVSEG